MGAKGERRAVRKSADAVATQDSEKLAARPHAGFSKTPTVAAGVPPIAAGTHDGLGAHWRRWRTQGDAIGVERLLQMTGEQKQLAAHEDAPWH
jgi:hypothetical protein